MFFNFFNKLRLLFNAQMYYLESLVRRQQVQIYLFEFWDGMAKVPTKPNFYLSFTQIDLRCIQTNLIKTNLLTQCIRQMYMILKPLIIIQVESMFGKYF